MAIFVQKISFNCHATRLQPSLLILISDTLSVSPFVRRRSHFQSESSDPPFSLFLLPLHRFHWDWQKVVVAAEAWSLLTRAATRLSNDHIWPKSKAAELASLSTARNTKMHFHRVFRLLYKCTIGCHWLLKTYFCRFSGAVTSDNLLNFWLKGLEGGASWKS